MSIEFYEVFNDCIRYDLEDEVYGRFSTYDKAKDLKDKLSEIDGHGVCVEELGIRKTKIELDKVEDWVNELIDNGHKLMRED